MSAQVSGVVLDRATQAPISDALVTVQTTQVRTSTGPDGSYELLDANGSDLAIVAAKVGYFNASVTVNSPATLAKIELDSVPQDDDSNYEFAEPVTCGGCHPQQLAQWTDSPMALAGSNTWVYDIYNGQGTAGGMGGFVYTRDSAFKDSNVNSECAACHQPEPWIEEAFPEPPADPVFKALDDFASLSEGSLHGISCEVCHKMANIDESKKNFPGIYPGVVTMTRPQGPEFLQVQYGVLGDTDYQLPNSMRPSYQPQLVSEACAACHQDKNDPDENHDFEEANGVISEPTYLEWLATPYADPESPLHASCADCHMLSAGATMASGGFAPTYDRDPETIRNHRIEGTTPAYLENAVEMVLQCEVVDDTIEAQVSITNNQTGHHVPTGVTIRNMILLVEGWREEDGMPLMHTGSQTVHELGGVGDPAQGYYADLPGKFYAKINEAANGQGPTFFTDAVAIQSDSRIPALATDVTNYTMVVPPGSGALHVRARLIYRRSFRFLVDAKGWTLDGHGNPLEDILPPYFGHLMEEEEWLLFAPFRRGDCNGDGDEDLSDAVFHLGFLFTGGDPSDCPEACDVNDDSFEDISDPIYLLAYVFTGGPSPAPPFLDCGPDPDPEGGLGCQALTCEQP